MRLRWPHVFNFTCSGCSYTHWYHSEETLVLHIVVPLFPVRLLPAHHQRPETKSSALPTSLASLLDQHPVPPTTLLLSCKGPPETSQTRANHKRKGGRGGKRGKGGTKLKGAQGRYVAPQSFAQHRSLSLSLIQALPLTLTFAMRRPTFRISPNMALSGRNIIQFWYSIGA